MGTRTWSKAISAVSLALSPILPFMGVAVIPGRSASTMMRLCRLWGEGASGSVRQKTAMKSQMVPFVMNILFPVITHSPPSSTALVLAEDMSVPASGSV